jgi:putative ABC transport system permease protein
MLAALHQFRRAPGHSLAFVTSLTIGIAATCTSFAVVKRAFLDPLPYPEPDRLVTVRTVVNGRISIGASYRFAQDLRGSGPFAEVSADWGRTVTYETPGASERVPGGAVTPNYFSVIGYRPALGAALTPGATDEVVVSWTFFQRALGGDPKLVGTSIVLDGVAHRVVGVMPHGFVAPYLSEAQLWTPLDVTPFLPERARGERGVVLQARLAEGATLPEARAFLDAFGERQRTQYPQAFARQTWVVDRLRDVLVEPSRTLLMGTAAATALLTLIVIANIAGLSAARATEVRRAHAVRLALGASHARLLREHFAESLILSATGVGSGLWLAALFIAWVVGYQQQFQLFLEDVPAARFDLAVAAIGVLLGLAAATVSAIVSQRVIAGVTMEDLLGAGRAFGHAKTSRTRGALVVLQLAVAVMLVFAAGLLVRTMNRIDSAPLGFESGGLAQFLVSLPAARYASAARVQQFETEVLDRLRGISGVDAASATLRMPSLGGPQAAVTLPGGPEAQATRAVSFAVAPGFFHFLGVPLRSGRELRSPTPATRRQSWW